MVRKAVSGIMLTSLLIGMLTLAFNVQPLEANPVYPGEVAMTREDIDTSISYAGSMVQARVDGTYSFQVYGTPLHPEMYYPVPPDASNVSVIEIEEPFSYPLAWDWNGTYYHTFIGDYPFIKWTIAPWSADFKIRTHYEHTVPLIEGKYQFLYAMGTGRYLAEPKFCEAYVKTYISKEVAPTQWCIEVYFVTEKGILEPATYEITSLNEMWNVTYYGDLYWSNDFLVTITPTLGDVNRNGRVDASDLFDLSKAFGSDPSKPNWNPNCDFNDDDKVDASDLFVLSKDYGKQTYNPFLSICLIMENYFHG